MSEYLSKEEIKQWRSSLERITLEEFAARLGKKVEEKKETNDLIDIVLHGRSVISDEINDSSNKAERLASIADKSYEREREIYISPFSAKNLKTDDSEQTKKSLPKNKITTTKQKTKQAKPKVAKSVEKSMKAIEKKKQEVLDKHTNNQLREEVRLTFKKALTVREEKVLEYFKSHIDETVYAKDLATLLGVPRDYVYKYIKNIREKVDNGENTLKNADKGGFIFSPNI